MKFSQELIYQLYQFKVQRLGRQGKGLPACHVLSRFSNNDLSREELPLFIETMSHKIGEICLEIANSKRAIGHKANDYSIHLLFFVFMFYHLADKEKISTLTLSPHDQELLPKATPEVYKPQEQILAQSASRKLPFLSVILACTNTIFYLHVYLHTSWSKNISDKTTLDKRKLALELIYFMQNHLKTTKLSSLIYPLASLQPVVNAIDVCKAQNVALVSGRFSFKSEGSLGKLLELARADIIDVSEAASPRAPTPPPAALGSASSTAETGL
jgi:hypothetical protein